jgi:outer membrane protein assembly factor BamB
VKLKCLVLVVLFAGASVGADWPEFRGPQGNGHAAAKDLPVHWSDKVNVRWRTEIAGRGWSSPVIEGDRIWMTTAIEIPLTDEERAKLEANKGGEPTTMVGRLKLRAVGVDRTSGKVVLDRELLEVSKPDPVHALNSFASPTPVIEDGKLYCHFGTNGTVCLDTKTQQIVWTNEELRIRHENGPGSSPILWGDLLIVHCDGSDLQYIVALDKHTGKIAWKTDRTGKLNENPQLKKAYGTPLVVNVDQKPLLLSPGADWLYAYDPATGKEAWRLSYEAQGFSIVPRPVAGHGMLYFSTSFMQPEILAVKLGGKQSEIAWRFKKQAPQMPSPLLVGDELYLVSDKGIATCLDAKTGEVHWSERLGGNFSSSPIYADGRIYVGNREGNTFVIAPGKAYKLLATNALEGSIMAAPAAIDQVIYLRTDKALYALQKLTTE